MELWKKYLSWEKSNPLRTEDQSLLTKRVIFAYEQCLLCLGHHPHVWYEAALFLQNSAKTLSDKGVSRISNFILNKKTRSEITDELTGSWL